MKGFFGGLFIALLLVFVAASFAQTPGTTVPVLTPLPLRDQVTIGDLKTQIADCSINAKSDAAYAEKLAARIRDLEKQVAFLTAKVADKGIAPLGKAE